MEKIWTVLARTPEGLDIWAGDLATHEEAEEKKREAESYGYKAWIELGSEQEAWDNVISKQ